MNAESSSSETPPPLPLGGANSTLLWLVVASVLGLLCFVLPTFFIPDAQLKHEHGQYAKTLIRWFATAYTNVQFWPSAISFTAVGLFLGWARTRSWKLLCWGTVGLCALLHTANIAYDVSQSPTTHNLLPFEFIIFAIFGFAAVVGGFLGSRLKQLRRPNVA